MTIADYIKEQIKKEGRVQKWVSEQSGIPYKTFVSKLYNDTFDGYDLVILSIVLNFSMDDLKPLLIQGKLKEDKGEK